METTTGLDLGGGGVSVGGLGNSGSLLSDGLIGHFLPSSSKKNGSVSSLYDLVLSAAFNFLATSSAAFNRSFRTDSASSAVLPSSIVVAGSCDNDLD